MSKQTLSPAQDRLLTRLREFEARHPEHADHQLVSGREYQSALALERRGLATVRYQGPAMGWARALPTHTDRAPALTPPSSTSQSGVATRPPRSCLS